MDKHYELVMNSFYYFPYYKRDIYSLWQTWKLQVIKKEDIVTSDFSAGHSAGTSSVLRMAFVC